MKQTQTKLFDFSDVGLDFCAGSKTLFPDRFKRILALGYNLQTVASVSVAGNQVTFEYGVSHGYVADRVLKVTSGPLAAIHGGEFVIDSVAATSLTVTIDDAPISIAGGFTTIVAPLGWELVYEQLNIHIYKFKHLDETDFYIRLCFENNSARRSNISPCIGKSYDVITGNINDPNCLQSTKNIASPEKFSWDFTDSRTASYDNYSFSQGYSIFGEFKIIGSKYHFLALNWQSTSSWRASVNGFLPHSNSHEKLKYPVLIGWKSSNGDATRSAYGQAYQYSVSSVTGYGEAWVGNYKVDFNNNTNLSVSNYKLVDTNNAYNSFYPSSIEDFNTTSAYPIAVQLQETRQFMGYCYGAYLCRYSNTNTPANTHTTSPSITSDIDLASTILIHPMVEGSSSIATYIAAPLEEIKIA